MSRFMGWLGVGFTLAYVAIVFAIMGDKIASIHELSLNEFGDFLAGIVGPIAIFWLVLGFFQQGLELRNSVKTLELQARELANSVEQQRELVEVTKDQLAHQHELAESQRLQDYANSLPKFFLRPGRQIKNGKNHNADVIMYNEGATASNIKVTCDLPNARISPKIIYELKSHQEKPFTISMNEGPPFSNCPINLNLEYELISGIIGHLKFTARRREGDSAIVFERPNIE